MSALLTLVLSMLGSELASAVVMRLIGRRSRAARLLKLLQSLRGASGTLRRLSNLEHLSEDDRRAVLESEAQLSSAQRALEERWFG